VTPATISGLSVSHRTASIEAIEQVSGGDPAAVAARLAAAEPVEEVFVLETCNRFEAYVVTPTPASGAAVLASVVASLDADAAVTMEHEESLRHLLRVAAGLESVVIGEDQILGQLKRAIEDARRRGELGALLEPGLMKAVHVGERVRATTGINEGVISMGSAAVQLAASERELTDAHVVVIGAGEMAGLIVAALADSGAAQIEIVNRTLPHAEHLAARAEVPATARALTALDTAVAAADVVFSATGADGYLLTPVDVPDAPGVIVDASQPRVVDPAVAVDTETVVFDMDDLDAVTSSTTSSRAAAAREAEAIIDEELEHLLYLYKRRRADAAISTMYEAAAAVRDREVATALNRLDDAAPGDAHTEEVIESMADAIIGQLLAAPTRSLRDAAVEDDWETIQTAMTLFDPNFSRAAVDEEAAEAEAPPTGGPPEGVIED
jgi:glutamyl-tRNA reductase